MFQNTKMNVLHEEALLINAAINDMIGERQHISVCDYSSTEEDIRLLSLGDTYKVFGWHMWAKFTASRLWANGAREQYDVAPLLPLADVINSVEVIESWLDDNVQMGSDIIFDNDVDNTDSAAVLPGVQAALIYLRSLAK